MKRARVALLAIAACTGGDARTSTEDAGAATRAIAKAAVPEVTSTAEAVDVVPAVGMQVVALTGEVAGIAMPAEVGVDQRVTLGETGALTLSLGDYVRLSLLGPATLQLAPEGAAALLLRAGTVSVDVAPRGARAGERTVWIGTRSGLLEVAHAARFVVRAHADGASTVSVVSGRVRVSAGEGDTMLAAGDTRCLTSKGAYPLKAMGGNLEERTSQLQGARSCARRPVSEAAMQDDALAQKLDALAAKKARTKQLLDEHARAASAHAEGALAVQAALAREAGAMEQLAAQARAARVTVDARLAGDEATRALHERAAALAPYR